jgi:hypothetical protein
MWVPYTEPLLAILPQEAIILPEDDIQRAALSAIFTREFETPAKAIAEIAKAYYYRTIFKGGSMPQTLKFEVGQLSAGESDETEWLNTNLHTFMVHWRNPGFKFRDKEKFFVRREFLDTHNYMNLQWVFSPAHAQEHIPRGMEWDEWVRNNLTQEDRYMSDLTRTLLDPSAENFNSLPAVVLERLPQFMESDSFVLLQVDRQHVDARDIVLVSKDRKLAAQVVRLARRYNRDSVVWLLDPLIYQTGRLYEDRVDTSRLRYRPGKGIRRFPSLDDALVIQDPGSILWNLYNSQNADEEGVSTDLGVEVLLRPIISEETRFENVYDVILDWSQEISTSSYDTGTLSFAPTYGVVEQIPPEIVEEVQEENPLDNVDDDDDLYG